MKSISDQSRTALPQGKAANSAAKMAKPPPTGPGIYSATYSNIPVYEFQFGQDLKEHVMRRRHDNWINATHILKAAGFDKPARTRILEREVVQVESHEKVQGGYGKYQGTWVPLANGKALAIRNGIYEKLEPIFEFKPELSNDSPPPAPKHTTNKPKAVRKPAVPKFNDRKKVPPPQRHVEQQDTSMYEDMSVVDEEAPDDITVASASFYGEDDRYQHDMSQPPTGHRKRKFNEIVDPHEILEQSHMAFADELLDYFLISQNDGAANRPEPPINFMPDFPIDEDRNTALHWACAMGDLDIIKELRRFGAAVDARNNRGETPLMRAVFFTNCQDKATMPRIVQELIQTINLVDKNNSTVFHHAAQTSSSRSKHHCARYYLDVILNKTQEAFSKEQVEALLDVRDINGNTACHLAAKFKAKKCIRALIGRGAATDIRNNQGVTAEEMIQEMNAISAERNIAASSSPFAQEPSATFLREQPSAMPEFFSHNTSHTSEAAMSVQSKVTPLLVEKLQHLATSFDDELNDRDKSEKEAKRILNQTHIELAQISEKLQTLRESEEDDEVERQEEAELSRAMSSVIALLEGQQELYLKSTAQQHEQMNNGSNGNGMHEDTLDLRLELYKMFEGEKERRKTLVQEYGEALSLAGIGEKVDKYRKLTSKVLQLDADSVDMQIDDLLKALDEGGPSEDKEGIGHE